jgi:peroxiredoxin Q/BCP
MPSLEAGDPAPSFELEDHAGQAVRLDDLRGRWVVLYWYPKDDTPGCTTEACEFRDNWKAVSAAAEVYGVSPDSVKSHEKFRAKFQLPFPLLADAAHATAESYGVWGLKKFMGREYMGVERVTFIIAPDGTIARVFRNVKPAGHAAEVLQALAELKGKG